MGYTKGALAAGLQQKNQPKKATRIFVKQAKFFDSGSHFEDLSLFQQITSVHQVLNAAMKTHNTENL